MADARPNWCYNCGSTDHPRWECPIGIKCFNCNQPGHKSADCKYPRRPRQKDLVNTGAIPKTTVETRKVDPRTDKRSNEKETKRSVLIANEDQKENEVKTSLIQETTKNEVINNKTTRRGQDGGASAEISDTTNLHDEQVKSKTIFKVKDLENGFNQIHYEDGSIRYERNDIETSVPIYNEPPDPKIVIENIKIATNELNKDYKSKEVTLALDEKVIELQRRNNEVRNRLNIVEIGQNNINKLPMFIIRGKRSVKYQVTNEKGFTKTIKLSELRYADAIGEKPKVLKEIKRLPNEDGTEFNADEDYELNESQEEEFELLQDWRNLCVHDNTCICQECVDFCRRKLSLLDNEQSENDTTTDVATTSDVTPTNEEPAIEFNLIDFSSDDNDLLKINKNDSTNEDENNEQRSEAQQATAASNDDKQPTTESSDEWYDAVCMDM